MCVIWLDMKLYQAEPHVALVQRSAANLGASQYGMTSEHIALHAPRTWHATGDCDFMIIDRAGFQGVVNTEVLRVKPAPWPLSCSM